MDKTDMLLQLQDLKLHYSEIAKDNEVYKKNLEALKMAIGIIFDTMEAEQLSAEKMDSDNITIKDICSDPDFKEKEIFIHLVWNNKDPYDPIVVPIWEGYMKDIPKEYMNFKVISTSRSMKDFQNGITGFYFRCENKYTIYIKQSMSKNITINALSENEAFREVSKMYNSGEITFSADDYDEFSMGIIDQEKTSRIENTLEI